MQTIQSQTTAAYLPTVKIINSEEGTFITPYRDAEGKPKVWSKIIVESPLTFKNGIPQKPRKAYIRHSGILLAHLAEQQGWSEGSEIVGKIISHKSYKPQWEGHKPMPEPEFKTGKMLYYSTEFTEDVNAVDTFDKSPLGVNPATEDDTAEPTDGDAEAKAKAVAAASKTKSS